MKKKLSIFMCTMFLVSLLGVPVVYSKEVTGMKNENVQLEHIQNKNVQLKIDSKKKNKIPKRFRKTTDDIRVYGKALNLKGLSSLNASGSAQFTGQNIKMVKEEIGNVPILVVDLREESHGFINDLAVSWVGEEKNNANKGLTREQVLKDESERLKSIKLNEKLGIEEKEIIPDKVQDERELTEENKMSYVRIPVTDTEGPTDEMVDYFISIVKKTPPGTWMHFHCKAGIGRTTTFMTMYDIMKNAKDVSLDDIMERQILLGGKNLLKPFHKVGSKSSERSEFIKKFYEYAKENKDNFNTSWSEWLKNHKDSVKDLD